MAAPQLVPPLTAEEFWKLPGPPHGGKMELVEGEVTIRTPVSRAHGRIAGRIAGRLDVFATRHQLGEAGVEAGFLLARAPDYLVAPDAYFIGTERLAESDWAERGFCPGPPDLAVEGVSPDDTDRAVNAKVRAYLAAGTPLVWVVRPEAATVTVHRPSGDGHTYGEGDTLGSADAGFAAEGFAVPLAELFA